MTKQAFFAHLAIGVAMLFAASAQAQFKLDEAPSAQRAQFAKETAGANATERLQDRKPRGARPLSSIGESQSISQTLQPTSPTAPLEASTGVVADPSLSSAVGPDGKPLPADPSVDDPNKPRQPLKPKSLSQGVAPR